MAINKVVYGDQTLVDLTQDSVSAENLLEGETAHDRSGVPVTGTAKQGHILKNQAGTAMTQRANMFFKDAGLSDNSAGAATEVEIIHQVTKSQLDGLGQNTDGIYETTDEDDIPIGDIEEDYVEVVADGEKTWSQLLDELWTKVDTTKASFISVLIIDHSVFHMLYMGGSYVLSNCNITSQVPTVARINIRTSGSKYEYWNGTTYVDYSPNTATSGIEFHYGNKKATVDLQTTANRCVTSDGGNVQQKLNITDVPATPVNGTITAGGVKRQGDLIVINIRYVSTSATAVGNAIVTFPYNITSSTAHVQLCNNKNYVIDLLSNEIRTNSAIASGETIIISGTVFVE